MNALPPSPEAAGWDQIWADAHDVDGWLTEAQGRALFDAAARCPPVGTVVEIGSFRGRSTIVLARSAPDGAEIVAIDPHAGTDRGPKEIDGYGPEAAADHACFLANLRRAGVHDRVRHVRRFSDRAHDGVEGAIDVLFVDGAHRFAPAHADIRDWGGRVVPGGTMLVHDSFSSVGVTLAILRELMFGRNWRYQGRVRSLAVYTRTDDDAGRWTSTLRQLAQLPWFAKNLGLKVLLTLGLGKLLRAVGCSEPEWPY